MPRHRSQIWFRQLTGPSGTWHSDSARDLIQTSDCIEVIVANGEVEYHKQPPTKDRCTLCVAAMEREAKIGISRKTQ